MRPGVSQVYNLFHPTDPVAARLEPLLSARFSMVPPVNIPRYQKYPLGDGQPYHLRKYSSFFYICHFSVGNSREESTCMTVKRLEIDKRLNDTSAKQLIIEVFVLLLRRAFHKNVGIKTPENVKPNQSYDGLKFAIQRILFQKETYRQSLPGLKFIDFGLKCYCIPCLDQRNC